jgi:chromosome segregation ATPase
LRRIIDVSFKEKIQTLEISLEKKTVEAQLLDNQTTELRAQLEKYQSQIHQERSNVTKTHEQYMVSPSVVQIYE